jgi:hypothetical protein
METFTINLGRCWIIRALGRNPLVRTSDRVEALMLVLAFAVALIAVPVAGAIGTSVHDARARLYAEESRDRHPVTANVTEDATKTVEDTRMVATAPARWRVNGVDYVETVKVDPQTKVGAPVEIWVDGRGNHAGPPTPAQQAGIDALVAGTASWLAVMTGVAGLWGCLRAGLTRRHARGWDRELRMLVDGDSGRTGNQT